MKRDSKGRFVKKSKVDKKNINPSPTLEIPAQDPEILEVPKEDPNEVPKTPIMQTQEIPVSPAPAVPSNSLLDDLMKKTDKDIEAAEIIDEEEREEESEGNEDEEQQPQEEKKQSTQQNTSSNKSGERKSIVDKIEDVITSEADEWENPGDRRKMAAAKALFHVETGSMFMGFLGQLISGNWDDEDKYTPSEKRKEAILKPLTKVYEIQKTKKNESPTKALWAAIILTFIPIIISATKDRQRKIKMEKQKLENDKLKEDLAKANETIKSMADTGNLSYKKAPVNDEKKTDNNVVEFDGKVKLTKDGTHRKNCVCEKCQSKRLRKVS